MRSIVIWLLISTQEPRATVRPPGAEDIATLRRARHRHRNPMGPAHKGVAGNEKADEWAKIVAEEPDTRGRMAELLGSNGGAGDASPVVLREPKAGDLGEKVGGGAPVG